MRSSTSSHSKSSVNQTMRRLSALGTPQNRKIYGRHGAPEPLFGVSYKDLGNLSKSIGTDHRLARELWTTKNVDAQNLATMVADPILFTSTELNRWARECRCSMVVDSFVRFVTRVVPLRYQKIDEWTRSPKETVGRAGWQTLASIATNDTGLSDAELERRIETIEREIHGAKNRKKEAMNNALIAIGGRNPALGRVAVAAAKRIGPVDVDHGETGCKTPDAVSYIKRMADRARAKRASAKK